MKAFAELYRRLDTSTATNDKRAALVDYLRAAPPADAAWALWFLSGNKLARIANGGELRDWVAERARLPAWLVEASYHHVGDLAETAALLLDDPPPSLRVDRSLQAWVEQVLWPVAGAAPALRRAAVMGAWSELVEPERLLFNKLITGELRVGASKRLVQQALADISGVEIARIAQRMLGDWRPGPHTLAALLDPAVSAGDREQPYPFFLASPLEAPAHSLGDIGDWLLEWKWDGIRLQLLRRGEEPALWSRGEERLDGRFPEIDAAATSLPMGTVLDGELLAWPSGPDSDRPLPFTSLQKRINRLKPGAKLLAEVPVRMQAYDLLELGGEDLRALPLSERRALLLRLLADAGDPRLMASPEVVVGDWDAADALRRGAREHGVEGLILKRRESAYQEGRRRGDWWKWKFDPLSIDAVLVYAQSGGGRRSTLYTDYTFALWEGDRLVPVAKAYSGLTDAEIARLDRWIRANTLERFGPVRVLRPEHVFELGFEAVNASTRHRSGVAVRFPRILRWREDKRAADADRVEALRALAR
jgi:DNA ligase-1